MSSGGYVYAYRGAWTHPAFNDLREAAIWNFLYQNAFWKDGDRNFNGTIFHLKRGQIVVSIRFLAEGFGMTPRGTQTVIQKLTRLGMIDNQTTNKATIITICNYDKYQTLEKTEDTQGDNQPENKRQTNRTNKKELSKDKEDKKEIEPQGGLFVLEAEKPTEKKKATRLPADWELPMEWGTWAMQQGLTRDEVLKTADEFKDYWIAKAGKDAAKLDWEATWRNWIRRKGEFKR